jgi:hypothetical protein
MQALSLALLCATSTSNPFSDPSLVASTSGSLQRVSSTLLDALSLEAGCPAPPASLFLPALRQSLLFGSPQLLSLPDAPFVLYLRPASTPLGELLRGLRCEAGWGEGCGGNATDATGAPAPPPGLVESATATLRLRLALWRRRHEFCEFAELLAAGALSLLAPAGWLGGGEALGRADVGGADAAAHALAACVLRRLRNAGTGVARLGGENAVVLPQEGALALMLGGSGAPPAPLRECALLRGFRSRVVEFVAGASKEGALVPGAWAIRADGLRADGGAAGVPAANASGAGGATPPPAPPPPPPSRRPGVAPPRVLFFSSSDARPRFAQPPTSDASLPPPPPLPTPPPPPTTLWGALLDDLQALRGIAAGDVFDGEEGAGENGGPCLADSRAREMMAALLSACASSPPPDGTTADALARHAGRLMLLGMLAGPGADDAGACLAGLPSPPPLFLCQPTSATAASRCPPHEVWAAPRDQLVAYWADLSGTAATLTLTHPRVADVLRRLLHYALAVGDISGWHPSGISPPGAPELLFSPQHMFYFASSYFFVHLEREYKAQLHRRMGSALARLKDYHNTQPLLVEATALTADFPVFNLRPGPLGSACAEGVPRVLVLSSYWDRGHSSHRITAPLSQALARHSCAFLMHAVTEEVFASGWRRWGRHGGNHTPPGANATAAAAAAAGAANRYDDAAAFQDVATYPVRESVQLQLGLWAHLTSPAQVSAGGGHRFFQLPDGSSMHAGFLNMEWGGGVPAGGAPEYPFDAVLYPSVGMSPNDMTLSSLRLARVQMVTYGHSSSSQSPAMDVFLGGVEPEVLGPLVADLYDLASDCRAGLDSLYALLRVALKQVEGGRIVGAEGGAFVGASAPGSPLRLPRVGLCDGAVVLSAGGGEGGTAARAGGGGAGASSTFCVLLDEYFVSAGGALGSADAAAVLSGHLPPELRPPPRCASTFPANQSAAAALFTRLVDAQRRYSERLVLLPGLGLWFTSVFPAYAPPARAMPALGADAVPALHAAAALMGAAMGASPGADPAAMPPLAAPLPAGTFLHALRGGAGAPWRGCSAAAPIRVSLVWSVVKWNARHLDRLLISLHEAQALWARAWSRCALLVAARGGGGSGAAAPLPQWAPPGASGEQAAQLCEALLSSFPGAAPPHLHLRLLAFSTSDGDAVKGAAFRAWVRRTLAAEFPGGHVSIAFITNATTPWTYYTQLGASELAFDSLPFSACNTMQDALALRVPIVSAAHDGEFEPGSATPLRWRSTIGASMLTRVGLSGLVAEGEADLVGKAAHLIANPFLRAAWKLRMDDAPEGELYRSEYASRDAQLVASLVKRTRP